MAIARVCRTALPASHDQQGTDCRSIGTLGGGNHFIEIDVDDENRHYLVIHSGSRNLGKQVAEHYQALAYDLLRTEAGKGVPKAKTKKAAKPSVPRDLAWLTGKHMADYLHDMRICQEYAVLNRRIMADIILREMGWEEDYQALSPSTIISTWTI